MVEWLVGVPQWAQHLAPSSSAEQAAKVVWAVRYWQPDSFEAVLVPEDVHDFQLTKVTENPMLITLSCGLVSPCQAVTATTGNEIGVSVSRSPGD